MQKPYSQLHFRKTRILGSYDISLLAKEMELRSLIMNWLATLNASEQTRIINEITTRLADYLNSDYQDFEISRVAKINLTDLKFQNSLEIEGIIPDSSFIDYRNSNLKIITISANGIFNKI